MEEEEGKKKRRPENLTPASWAVFIEDPLTSLISRYIFPAAPPQRLIYPLCVPCDPYKQPPRCCQPIRCQYQELDLVPVSATVRLHEMYP